MPSAADFKFVLDDPIFGSEASPDWFDRVTGALDRWWIFDRPRFPVLPESAPRLPVIIEETPEGWETVIIGGEERLRVPQEIGGGPEPVLEPFDPSVVIGDVQGADTVEQEDVDVAAHDWGSWLRSGLSGIIDTAFSDNGQQYVGGGGGTQMQSATAVALGTTGVSDGCDGMVWAGGAPPKGYKVVNYCGQGVLRKVRRRRRRRLLTRGDSQDIATIVGLVGKGQMASALINRRT